MKVPEDKSRIIFLETNLSEVGSLALERRMIRWYGRKDIETGILRNRTDGGDAPPNHTGMKRSSVAKQRMKDSHVGFSGLTHTQESKDKWVETRRADGSYKPTIEQIERLRHLRKMHAEQYCVKICIFGKEYDSQKEACLALNVGIKYLKRRLKSESFIVLLPLIYL